MGQRSGGRRTARGGMSMKATIEVRDAAKATAPGARLRLGIRGRLFAAFGAVAGMTVLASAVAFLSYTQLGETLHALTTDNMPAMNTALRVARTSAEIAAAAPSLLAATSTTETTQALALLGA